MLPRRTLGCRSSRSWPDMSQRRFVNRHRVPRPERQTGEALGEKPRKNPEPPAKKFLSTQWVTAKVKVKRTDNYPGSRLTRPVVLSRSEKPKAKVAPQVEDQDVDGRGVGELRLRPKVRAAVARTNLLDDSQADTGIVAASSDSDITDYTDPLDATDLEATDATALDITEALDITDHPDTLNVSDNVDATEPLDAADPLDTLDLKDSQDVADSLDATKTDTAANLDGLADLDEESMARLQDELSRYDASCQLRALQYEAIYRDSQALLDELRGISRGLDDLRLDVDTRMGSLTNLAKADSSDLWEDPAPGQPPSSPPQPPN